MECKAQEFEVGVAVPDQLLNLRELAVAACDLGAQSNSTPRLQ